MRLATLGLSRHREIERFSIGIERDGSVGKFTEALDAGCLNTVFLAGVSDLTMVNTGECEQTVSFVSQTNDGDSAIVRFANAVVDEEYNVDYNSLMRCIITKGLSV